MSATPLILPPNQFRRFYSGGARIDALRGVPAGPDGRPEDWIGSTTTAFGEEAEGLSRVADGRLVFDLIRADPDSMLGPDHVRRFGPDPGLLVKLLDAGERLPVHAHPGRAFARERLGSPWGKTEAWLILAADPGATVHVGLREPLDAAALRRWVDEQDAAEMLDALHELPVRAGTTVLVPAGTLHAIGAGILLLELQEPSDLSVLVEWERFGVRSGAEHLQLGWDAALASIDRAPGDPTPLVRHAPPAGDAHTVQLLPPEADPYFRAERVRPGGGTVVAPPSFAVVVVTGGEGLLRSEDGGELQLRTGTTALVPYAAGSTELAGGLEAIRCLPPDPDAEEGAW
jgi:mannose-6-phosphate isomerase